MERETSYELIRDYYKIKNPKLSGLLKEIIHEIARTNFEKAEENEEDL